MFHTPVEPPLAGGTNVFGDQANTYITVSKESFAVQKPEAYVLVHYKDVDATQFAATLNEAWN